MGFATFQRIFVDSFFPWIFVDKNHRKFRSYLTGCHTCYTFNMVLSMSEMVRSASFRHNLTPLAFEKKTIGRFTLILLSDILGFFKSTVFFCFGLGSTKTHLLGTPSIQRHQHILRHGLDSTRRFRPWTARVVWMIEDSWNDLEKPQDSSRLCVSYLGFVRIPRVCVSVSRISMTLSKGTKYDSICGILRRRFVPPTESRLWQRPKGCSPNFVATLKHNRNVSSVYNFPWCHGFAF